VPEAKTKSPMKWLASPGFFHAFVGLLIVSTISFSLSLPIASDERNWG